MHGLLILLAILAVGFLILNVLPDLWARLFLRRPVQAAGLLADFARHGQYFVALTFDDGPDPETTPLVLEALAELGVSATFFMLGDRIAAHPEVARRVAEKAHLVASHGYRHRLHWLMTPWEIGRDLCRARDLMFARELGLPPRPYRPPWGMISLATCLAARRAGMRLCLYDVESGDWLRRGPEDIARRVLARVRPGSVVLFHDAAKDRRQVEDMIAALRQIVPVLRDRGYMFTSVFVPPPRQPSPPSPPPAGGGRGGLLLRAWIAWEHLFGRIVGAVPVGETMHLAPYTYRGPTRLRDGQEVLKSGDRCLDIHFNSQALYQMPGHAAARYGGLMEHFYGEMRQAARMMADEGRFPDVRAITAITLFHPHARRVGFRSEPVEPPWRRRFFTRYMEFIKRVYGGSASAMPREVRFIWMTREEFLARMLGKDE